MVENLPKGTTRQNQLAVMQRLSEALSRFFEIDAELFEVGVNERSLTHKLAEHLQAVFSEWHVDCEYNRLGTAIKKLPSPETISSDDVYGQTIYPDIIVHRRKQRENLLVIEVKKSSNRREGDEYKLCGLTEVAGDYGYLLGLHLIFVDGEPVLEAVRVYESGGISDDLTAMAGQIFSV